MATCPSKFLPENLDWSLWRLLGSVRIQRVDYPKQVRQCRLSLRERESVRASVIRRVDKLKSIGQASSLEMQLRVDVAF